MKQLTNLTCDTVDAPDMQFPTAAHFSASARRLALTKEYLILYNDAVCVKVAVADLFALAQSKEPNLKALTKEEMKSRQQAILAQRQAKQSGQPSAGSS